VIDISSALYDGAEIDPSDTSVVFLSAREDDDRVPIQLYDDVLELLRKHKKNIDVVMVNRGGIIFTFSEGWNEPLVTVCTSDNIIEIPVSRLRKCSSF
jgi:hypothetical protein